MRVVSLLPSATEIVYALGLGDQLVGVTFECDEPPTARRDKTVVVGGHDTSGMSPGEIDAYIGGGRSRLIPAAATPRPPGRRSRRPGQRWPWWPCGFRLDGAAAQAEQVARQLPGVPVWAIDADGLVVRPGPRLVDGIEGLAAILHPDQVTAPPADRIRRVA